MAPTAVPAGPSESLVPRILALHGLEREWGDLTAFGFPVPPPPGTHALMGKATLALAAADGTVTPTEKRFLLGRARMFGASDDELAELVNFDPRAVRLEDLVRQIPVAARRQVLYDAILVARSDGFGEKERQSAFRMAEKLSLEREYVNAIEAHLTVEDAVRRARIRLATPPK